MATIIDDDPQEIEGTTDITDITLETQAAPEQTLAVEQAPEVPEKYQGKSITDIVQMHQEAEKALGRQGGEVGELRKIVDEFITTQSQTVAQAQETVTEIDFFEDPQGAVARAVSSHPDVIAAREATRNFSRQSAQAQIIQKHPDAEKIIQDPEFNKWVQSDPIKTELARKAAVEHNFEVVDSLLTDWKDRQQLVSQTLRSETNERKSAVNKASTGSAKGSVEQSTKKMYRRADIIKLMQSDPDRYEALQPEIMAAYSEGRVK